MNIVKIACLALNRIGNPKMTVKNREKDAIYSAYEFSGKVVKNRLVAQAMEINSAIDDGGVGPEIIERYGKLSRGGWGIVFVEAVSITDEYMARENGLLLTRKNLDGFKRLVDSFKKIDDKSLIMFQLTHSGRQSGDLTNRIKAYEDEDETIPMVTIEELEIIREQFLEAAELSKETGADGVDIKACHGYLLGELLRPKNLRGDGYGGDAVGRANLLSSIISSIKADFGDLVIGTRVSIYEGIRGGCGTGGPDEVIEELGDMLDILSHIVKAGADFLNISAGIPPVTPSLTRPDVNSAFNLYHHFRYAKVVKEAFPDVAVIGSAYSSGMENSGSLAGENIEKGYTDFAGFGRQNLADPLYPKKLAQAPDTVDYCVLCGGCSGLLKKQKPVYCVKYQKR